MMRSPNDAFLGLVSVMKCHMVVIAILCRTNTVFDLYFNKQKAKKEADFSAGFRYSRMDFSDFLLFCLESPCLTEAVLTIGPGAHLCGMEDISKKQIYLNVLLQQS